MEKLLEQLEGILKRESEIHRDLLKTAGTFNEAIKADDLEAIQNCTSLHDEQVYQISKLEEKRIGCVNDIAGMLEIPGDAPKMITLLQRVPDQWKKRLSDIQMKLKRQIDGLSKINTSNRILLQEALSFINSNIVMYQQSSSGGFQYGGKGKPAGIRPCRNLFNKVV